MEVLSIFLLSCNQFYLRKRFKIEYVDTSRASLIACIMFASVAIF